MNPRRAGIWLFVVAALVGARYMASQGGDSVNESPGAPPAFGQCAWTWAYHPLPEISAKFEQLVRAEIPQATAFAQAFGEDCMYEDGHADFAMKEVDFYVRIPSVDLTQEETFGAQMAAVMSAVLREFPADSLRGGHSGFVEFAFEHNETERVAVRVPIEQYKGEAIGTTGRELFNYFRQNP